MDSNGLSEESYDRYGDGQWAVRIPAHWQDATPLPDRDWGFFGKNLSGGGFTRHQGSAYRYASKATALVKADQLKAEGRIEAYEVVYIPHPALGVSGRQGSGGRA